MKRSWYSDMQRLGRRTGLGMKLVVRAERSMAEHKMQRRTPTVLGEPEQLREGSRLWLRPIMTKRTGKILGYRASSQPGDSDKSDS